MAGARRAREGRTREAGGESAMAAGEAPIKQAVQWIDDRLQDDPQADRLGLVDEAARRYDLSPIDTDFLLRHLAERRKA
jgi:hypothetical protein